MSNSAPRVALICGSLREGSINQKLLNALKKRVIDAGADAVEVSLSEYYFPLYHGDLDTPPEVRKLIDRLKEFDGIIIVTPEYNGGLPPLLKNTIDWTSTVETGHISGPVYGIAACSPGPMSGIMCLRQLQFILMRLGAELVPTQVGCGNADKAFDDEGNLIAETAGKLADKMIGQVLERIARKS